MDNYKEFTIIVPTFNEKENIAELLNELSDLYAGVNVIVADDQSKDGTQDVVRGLVEKWQKNGRKLKLFERIDVKDRGITASVIDALSTVQTKFFAVMDGDLQHPPKVFADLVAKLNQGYDIVVGCRIPYKENQGIHRIAMTRIATFLAKSYLAFKGYKFSDPMSGFFVALTNPFRDSSIKHKDRFEPKGYKILFDLLKVTNRKLKLAEVQYQFQFRQGGKSKLRPAHAFYFLRSLIKK